MAKEGIDWPIIIAAAIVVGALVLRHVQQQIDPFSQLAKAGTGALNTVTGIVGNLPGPKILSTVGGDLFKGLSAI